MIPSQTADKYRDEVYRWTPNPKYLKQLETLSHLKLNRFFTPFRMDGRRLVTIGKVEMSSRGMSVAIILIHILIKFNVVAYVYI